MLIRRILVAVLCLPLVAASPSQVPVDGYKIVHTYPHDPNSFTQGLVFVDGHLYESTGRNGHSSLRMVDLSTGWVLKEYDLPEEYFGEGVTDWRDTLIQLTWISGVAFVYDRSTFTVRRTLHYTGEGWGLTHDSSALILSDGTPTLRFLDPNSFREIKKINVRDGSNQPVRNLNELEYIHGEIYANIWHENRIARISPSTGRVLGWIDLTGLLKPGEVSDPEAVLNGIAYDAKADGLFVTGKLWPKLFEIKIVPKK
ncbi:MAG TPA: glutaminyl-peptide cyclotransferase [Terriglobales bacterium]|jgi:glutamine cyclotransferase|nr:glutaminyl-peptide cyclotransferase [Terriglobales bacterium]